MKTILIIEDDAYIGRLCTDALGDEGYNIISINEGIGAFELAKKEKPDLILLDILLPGKDGYEVFSELKSDEDTKKIPIVILTNLGQDHSISKSIEEKADGFYVKSNTSVENIVEIVAKHI
jgi:CheY-like chemotaxis protein